MIRNFKRTVAVLGAVAAGSIALTACSESNETTSGDAGTKIEGLSGTTGNLVAEGASSQQKAVDLFGVKYAEAVSGANFSYTPSGSGSGQKQFIAGQVAFGGSDSALKDDQIEAAKQRCGGNEAWHLPMVIGPVAVAYNVKGADNIVLTPELTAKIFKGEITKWNAPEIAAINKDAKLPDTDIKVVYRSEESGTTDNFQKFLKATSNGVWEGSGKSFPAAVGAGANGSTGVVGEVSATEGAITYVEAGFAKDAGLGVAKMDFGQGAVELNKDSVNKALAKLQYKGEGNNMVVDSTKLFEMKEAGAYPLVLTTYEIVCSAGYDAETSGRVKDFLKVALANQGSDLEALGYIPVDGEFKKKLETAVDAIK
ncbi:Phosphate-binding protein PstS 3 precursor [Corynebacterium kalinowskii]|uniref:Phosphate-binding protein n=1 Tax=Corynebacterium kalinowskii TaxID=2675216 RepID=A0A6B8VRD4_9CORY|nr:phosphate ABC transporter substrate-binding protein PstS [Corynebacterium kalinowskii]QGU01326.1 Phosphate-binding protein PstS 3 precursor [Corynebacterium kalinowskii]